jgi:hypothetical protein
MSLRRDDTWGAERTRVLVEGEAVKHQACIYRSPNVAVMGFLICITALSLVSVWSACSKQDFCRLLPRLYFQRNQ